MNIAGYAVEIKAFIEPYFRIIAIILVACIAFGVCRIWQEKTARLPLTITMSADPSLNGQASDVYASKTGTKYYFPWCGSVARIKPASKIEFPNVAAAIAAGYGPAANCKGVK